MVSDPEIRVTIEALHHGASDHEHQHRVVINRRGGRRGQDRKALATGRRSLILVPALAKSSPPQRELLRIDADDVEAEAPGDDTEGPDGQEEREGSDDLDNHLPAE